MRQFEFPYNFDENLLNILSLFDPEGKTINCIYLPPYIKDYQTILRTGEQAYFLDNMTRDEYEKHIFFINTLFPKKIQILLQKKDLLLSEDKIKYYISLGVQNFCVASIEQAKLIKNISPKINVVGSISMQITKKEIFQNFSTYKLYFDAFVLPFSASRKLNTLKYYPRQFKYILLVNASCHINCKGAHHWNFDYKNDQGINCPGKLGDIPWDKACKIRPMDLGLFDPYIDIYKLQDRGWPTEMILRDYILYTSDYNDYPNISYTNKIYSEE